jgi:hypothetical protein
MGKVLDILAKAPPSAFPDEADILAIVRKQIVEANSLSKHVTLERGTATIPLKGIDVPFHSSYIRNGVESYRKYLESMILEENIDVDKLVGKFIPNVTGKPFSIDKDYVEYAAHITNSTSLRELLNQVSKHFFIPWMFSKISLTIYDSGINGNVYISRNYRGYYENSITISRRQSPSFCTC